MLSWPVAVYLLLSQGATGVVLTDMVCDFACHQSSIGTMATFLQIRTLSQVVLSQPGEEFPKALPILKGWQFLTSDHK